MINYFCTVKTRHDGKHYIYICNIRVIICGVEGKKCKRIEKKKNRKRVRRREFENK